jgi:hypothetical protein
MRIVTVVALIFCALIGTSNAGQFGPLDSTAEAGKFTLGVGYFFEDTKWKADDFGDFRTESNQYYLQVSYGLPKNWEVYGRIGGADMKLKSDGFLDGTKDSTQPFGTLGIKGAFFKKNQFSFGAFAQGTYRSEYKDSATVGGTEVDSKFKDHYDINVGLAAQLKFGNFLVYGGPFWYYARAKAELSASGYQDVSETVKEKDNIGGFLGVKIPITKRVGLNIEGQLRDRTSYGAMITYAF